MSIRSTLLVTILAMAALPFAADAQVLYGSLTGNVADVSGAAVPNASVEATNVATGIAKKTRTDDRGVFLIQDIQAGTYKVTISAPAFATTGRVAAELLGLEVDGMHKVTQAQRLACLAQATHQTQGSIRSTAQDRWNPAGDR